MKGITTPILSIALFVFILVLIGLVISILTKNFTNKIFEVKIGDCICGSLKETEYEQSTCDCFYLGNETLEEILLNIPDENCSKIVDQRKRIHFGYNCLRFLYNNDREDFDKIVEYICKLRDQASTSSELDKYEKYLECIKNCCGLVAKPC